jgi:predicted type IV restriction endonuclease
MSAPDTIGNLVERFERNHDQYRSGKYNETQLRREFLDPFFEALGWDLLNKQGYAETYKDVIHEDSLEIEGATKAPDYAFRQYRTKYLSSISTQALCVVCQAALGDCHRF